MRMKTFPIPVCSASCAPGSRALRSRKIDRLENYVLALGIRGKKRWEQEWTRATDRMDPAEPEACSGFRDRLMEKLSPWIEAVSPKRAELREYGKALYEFLTGFQIQQQLRERDRPSGRRASGTGRKNTGRFTAK